MLDRELGTAESLYRSIVEAPDPLGRIKRLVEDRAEESDYLEFKRYEPGKDFKPKWGKMLSGFANAGGGVVVWGIDTARIDQGTIDKAVKLVPIQEPEVCRSALTELANRMTDPPIRGVECRAIIDTDGRGFVICYVPNGSHKPYRSIVEAGHPFYLRAGDDFHPININLLRMLFYPQRSVQWSMEIQATGFEADGEGHLVRFFSKLVNRGPSSSTQTVIAMKCNLPVEIIFHRDALTEVQEAWKPSGWIAIRDIHPGMTLSLNFNVRFGPLYDSFCKDFNGPIVTFEFTIWRSDSSPVKGSADVSYDTVANRMLKQVSFSSEH